MLTQVCCHVISCDAYDSNYESNIVFICVCFFLCSLSVTMFKLF
jgi:hypothetical protein